MTPTDSNAGRVDFSQMEMLEEVLGHVASSVPIGVLEYSTRWLLLTDALCGVPVVSSGGRPRDYPFSHTRALCLEVVNSLRQSVAADGTRHCFYLLDLILALRIVTTCRPPQHVGALDEHDFESLIVELLRLVTTTLYGDSIGSASWFQRLGQALNIGAVQRERQLTANARVRFDVAKRAASVCMAWREIVSEEPQLLMACREERVTFVCDRLGIPSEAVLSLADWQFLVVTVKVSGIQRYISRARVQWLKTGPSAWCSRVTSHLRDKLLGHGNTSSSLFLDSDARVVIINADEGPAGWLPNAIRNYLDRESLQARYPMLHPWLQGERPPDQPDSIEPDIRATEEQSTLLEFVVGGSAWNPSYASSSKSKASEVVRFQPTAEEFGVVREADVACGQVFGAHRFESYVPDLPDLPPWYANVGMGPWSLMAMAWSLCGESWSLLTENHVIRHVEQELAIRHPEVARASRPLSRDWMRLKNNISAKYVYLRVDGNSVGKAFLQKAPMGHPELSCLIDRDLHRRWIGANAEAIIRVAGVHPDWDVVLPTLLYFAGGDDLFGLCPVEFFQDLLCGFDEVESEQSFPSYRFSAVEVQKGSQPEQWEINKALDALIRHAKIPDTPPPSLEQLRRELSGPGGSAPYWGVNSSAVPWLGVMPWQGSRLRGLVLRL